MTYIYPGAAHIHTKYSDGTATIPEIAFAAKKAGLSWIIISDHNTIAGYLNGEEGWYNGVAVLIGSEISPDDSDHYLAFNIAENVSPEQAPQDYINRVKKLGGIGFIAHPDERKDRKSGYKPLRWTDWNVKGFNGIEIWNHLSDWVDGYDSQKPLKHFLLREHGLTGPTEAVMKWWDELNNNSKTIVPAIGGVDVHCLHQKYFGIPVKVFPYLSSLKTVTNFLFLENKLSDDFAVAKKQILTALKAGQNIIANRTWNKQTPLFYFQNNAGQIYPGSSVKAEQYSKLCAHLPLKAVLRLIYNGRLVWEHETNKMEFNNPDEGKYRIEAYYRRKPWVFSNPIQIIK